jgi:uncharacterized protein YcaQ
MPMLWGEHMLGWANLKVVDGQMQHRLGFVGPRPRGKAFQPSLDEALQQMREFLQLWRSKASWWISRGSARRAQPLDGGTEILCINGVLSGPFS